MQTYEPPQISELGTVAQLTRATNLGTIADQEISAGEDVTGRTSLS